ncbi:MAG: hypothetical protein LC797_03880 [Chloroflexi bacterium]|nr:hypothetical protein [Chloroflexota bacterium]
MTDDEVDQFLAVLQDPQFVMMSHLFVSVRGQKRRKERGQHPAEDRLNEACSVPWLVGWLERMSA